MSMWSKRYHNRWERWFLVKVNDENALADKINLLIGKEKLRQQISNAAIIKAEQYNINNITPMWMQLFTTLNNENK